MFKINEYKIVFKRKWHDRRRPICKALRESNGQLTGVELVTPENDGRYDTRCEIYITQDRAVVGSNLELVYNKEPRFTGIARLHPNDKPDKVVGKKIALRNAIGVWLDYHKEWQYNCADFYNKEVRAAIWWAFRKWVESWVKECKNCKKRVNTLHADLCEECWTKEFGELGQNLEAAGDNNPY